ncbi:NADPH:quinone oxidoreductase family protein [Catenuloplanes atrovinosus]|uniref:NADPH2:quinone reductase n=1 Tax=Catenuloplanes atrovinosus TaxID=137266 RepID=A0AAE3YK93_9ACTN|nr:NADPH:quinone oxidoreductase family protein [Catenuloplanes atrovinosus]MDR7274462.1 NADPH2:quinone reductase [Catenuloplanes atrovinosus]
MRAVQITEFGGPELLTVSEVPEPVPGDGEVVLDVLAAGVNYADTHQTEDSYLAKQTLPLIPGGEAIVRGPDGRRYATLVGSGAYAERVLARPDRLIPVPDGVDDAAALGTLVQGSTAYLLIHRAARLEPGESVVVHAGAGGTGSQAIQLARRAGAGRVIATASTPDKRAITLDLGADAAVDVTGDDLRDRLIEANGGAKVDVVLEMSGGPVFDASLRALAPLGRLVHFGMASRTPATPVLPSALMRAGRSVIGFWLFHVIRSRPDLYAAAVGELLGALADGSLRSLHGGEFPLEKAADAHRALLGRTTSGKLILRP